MKVLRIARMLLFFILLSVCLAEPAPAAAAPAEPPKVYACNKDILRSYMLRGRETSTPEKMILCPAIKSNCCTKMDQQHIYHVVNDILPPRLMEYQSKIKMALSKLKLLHKHIMKANPVFTGSSKRRAFSTRIAATEASIVRTSRWSAVKRPSAIGESV